MKRTESSISLSPLSLSASLSASDRPADIANKKKIIDKVVQDEIQFVKAEKNRENREEFITLLETASIGVVK